MAAQVPYKTHLYETIIRLISENGYRSLRTSQIAKAAATSELTMFRHVSSLDEAVAEAIEWSWTIIASVVQMTTFTNPTLRRHEKLIAEFDAIWHLRETNDAIHAAAIGAFCVSDAPDFADIRAKDTACPSSRYRYLMDHFRRLLEIESSQGPTARDQLQLVMGVAHAYFRPGSTLRFPAAHQAVQNIITGPSS